MSDEVPLVTYRGQVLDAWIDINGHMNARYFSAVIYDAHVALTDYLGLGDDYVARTGCGKAVVESHLLYERELKRADPIEVRSWLLEVDAKRLHFFHELMHTTAGYRAAAGEQLDIHIDLGLRRSAPFADDTLQRLKAVAARHAAVPPPSGVGRSVAMRRSPRS